MANMVYHELYFEGIKEKLVKSGLVDEKSLTSRSYPDGKVYPFVLDYGKCNPTEWEKEKAEILKDGVVDYAKRDENGKSGVRRDYTPAEQAELGFYPVEFSEDGNKMTWFCRYTSNDGPAFYASAAFPEEIMILTASYEDEFDGGCYLKNGKSIAEMPTAPLIGANGNIFNLMGIAYNALKEVGLSEQGKEMQKRVTSSNSYEEALAIISDYVVFGTVDF